MSHVVVIDLKIDDLGSLEAAAKALGLDYRHGQTTFRTWESINADAKNDCQDAICVPNNREAYEIGVVAQGDGYTLLWDSFDGGYGLVAIIGKDATKLKDEYAAAVATKQYELDGFTISRSNSEDGHVLLEAYR